MNANGVLAKGGWIPGSLLWGSDGIERHRMEFLLLQNVIECKRSPRRSVIERGKEGRKRNGVKFLLAKCNEVKFTN